MTTNRRSFLSSLLLGSVAPLFLPGAGRIWKPTFTSGGIVIRNFDIFPFGAQINIPSNYILRISENLQNLEWVNPEVYPNLPCHEKYSFLDYGRFCPDAK